MEAQEWLGATIKEDGVEMSGMVWLFHRWAERERGPLGEFRPVRWSRGHFDGSMYIARCQNE